MTLTFPFPCSRVSTSDKCDAIKFRARKLVPQTLGITKMLRLITYENHETTQRCSCNKDLELLTHSTKL